MCCVCLFGLCVFVCVVSVLAVDCVSLARVKYDAGNFLHICVTSKCGSFTVNSTLYTVHFTP